MADVRIMLFSIKWLTSSPAEFNVKIRRRSPRSGAQTGNLRYRDKFLFLFILLCHFAEINDDDDDNPTPPVIEQLGIGNL